MPRWWRAWNSFGLPATNYAPSGRWGSVGTPSVMSDAGIVLVVAIAAGLIVLLVNAERRHGGREAKADALREFVGTRVTLYVGTKGLFGHYGLVVSVDAGTNTVRLIQDHRDLSLLLDRVVAVGDADGLLVRTL